MTIIILTLIFILGLVVGSFINALEYRIGTELSIAKGRSICPECNRQIAWYDNVPVLSYLFLAGKCRQCKKPISLKYPIIEVLTGLGFVAVAAKIIFNFQFSIFNQPTAINIFSLGCLFVAVSCLILIGLHDAKTGYIISPAVYIGAIAIVTYRLINYGGAVSASALWQSFSVLIVATAIPALVFAGLHFFSKGRWMGAGDIELAILVGLFAGWPGIFPAYYFAFIVGSIWGLTLVYLAKKAKMKSEMPFGPFLTAGAIFGFTFGQQIVDLYARIFLGA